MRSMPVPFLDSHYPWVCVETQPQGGIRKLGWRESAVRGTEASFRPSPANRCSSFCQDARVSIQLPHHSEPGKGFNFLSWWKMCGLYTVTQQMELGFIFTTYMVCLGFSTCLWQSYHISDSYNIFSFLGSREEAENMFPCFFRWVLRVLCTT